MTKKKESIATLAILENEEPVLEEEETDDAIQAPKQEPKPILKKPRPPKSQKQLDAWQITKEKGIIATKLRKQLADEAKQIKKEEKEERIVKTAIVIKRKQIKRNKILDEVSDGEDEPPPKIRKSVSIKEPEKPPAHQFIFV